MHVITPTTPSVEFRLYSGQLHLFDLTTLLLSKKSMTVQDYLAFSLLTSSTTARRFTLY